MKDTLTQLRERRALAAEIEAQGAEQGTQVERQLRAMSFLQQTILEALDETIRAITSHNPKVTIKNMSEFPDSIKTPDMAEVAKAIAELKVELKPIPGEPVDMSPLANEFKELRLVVDKLPKEFPAIPDHPDTIEISNIKELVDKMDRIGTFLSKLEPTVNVAAPEVKVAAPDLKKIEIGLTAMKTSFDKLKIPETDLTEVEKKLKKSNELLQELLEKRWGGGGGSGGHSTPYTQGTKASYVALEADGSVPVTVKSGGSSGSIAKPTDAYALAQIDDTTTPATYEYYGYEDKDLNWYIKRYDVVNGKFEFIAGLLGGVAAQWSGRAGYTYASYGATF